MANKKGKLKDRFIVRVMGSEYANPSGNIGPKTNGKVRYWATTFDQIENADTDPKLLAEAIGTDYDPNTKYSMLIIDTNGADANVIHQELTRHSMELRA